MIEKNYQLVAWTGNVADKENARLYMIPSLECEMRMELIGDIAAIHREEHENKGIITLEIARRGIRVCEKMAEFQILTGHFADAVRYIFFAARYCIWEDDLNWSYMDTDLGRYSHFCGEPRHDFTRLCETGISLARRHGCRYVLLEKTPEYMLDLYYEHTREERDLITHTGRMSTWS